MKKNPKVCFIMQSVSPGTHMDYVFEMVKALHDEGSFSIRLLVEKPKQGVQLSESWVFLQKFSFAPLRVLENFILLLRERLSGTKIFYIHYSFLSAISAGLVTKLLGGKVLYWNAGLPWQYKRDWWARQYESFAYRCIDVLVTGAPALVAGYAKAYTLKPSRIKVIPNWIDLQSIKITDNKAALRAELSLPKDVPILLFVHRIAKRKGAQWLVPLMQTISNGHCHLVVAGDGPELEHIRKAAAHSGVSDRIHLLGRVDRRGVTKLFQAADIFIMPSEEEGSPHSLIEAMAYGLPFVAYDVGGVADTTSPDSHGYLFPYGDITALARGVDSLLQDPSEYQRAAQTGSAWVQRFDKPIVVRKFVELLQEISKRT